MCNVTVSGKSERFVRERTDELARYVREAVLGLDGDWEVLGPAECVRARVKDRFRRHVVLKCPVGAEPGPILAAAASRLPARRGVSLAIDVDAYDMM